MARCAGGGARRWAASSSFELAERAPCLVAHKVGALGRLVRDLRPQSPSASIGSADARAQPLASITRADARAEPLARGDARADARAGAPPMEDENDLEWTVARVENGITMGMLWNVLALASDGRVRRLREVLSFPDLHVRQDFPPHRQTVLHAAAEGRQANAVKVLLELGADVRDRTADGKTPLHSAVSIGARRCPLVVSQLLAAGSDVRAEDSMGMTPLHISLTPPFHKESIACAELLLQAGADVNTFDHYSRSPLDVTLQFGCRPLAMILLRNGSAIPKVIQTQHMSEVPSHLRDRNLDVRWQLYFVKDRGGWKEHARAHRRLLSGLVSKCGSFPDDAAGIVVDFWVPEGGW